MVVEEQHREAVGGRGLERHVDAIEHRGAHVAVGGEERAVVRPGGIDADQVEPAGCPPRPAGRPA